MKRLPLGEAGSRSETDEGRYNVKRGTAQADGFYFKNLTA